MSLTSTLEGYLRTAAGTMSAPPCNSVRPGEPDNVNLPTIAYWFQGVRTWEANTLNQTQELSGWHIRIYAPATIRYTPADGGIELWVSDLTNAIRGQLYGHVGAGGTATGQGMELTDAIPGWAQVPNGILCRVVDMDWWAMLSNVHPIAV